MIPPKLQPPLSLAEQWLAGEDPYNLARDAWLSGGVASIEATAYDVIILNVRDVVARIEGIKDEAAIVARFKAVNITSGVIVWRQRTTYSVLVPPRSTRGWIDPRISCVGQDHESRYAAVPRSTRTTPPGVCWLLPAPDGEEMLASPANVLRLIGREPQ